jgi:hypothetical protein
MSGCEVLPFATDKTGQAVNPLEFQVLVLLSGVPEASAGSVFAYDAAAPTVPVWKPLTKVASSGRRWPHQPTELSGVPRHVLMNRWVEPFSGETTTRFRQSRSSSLYATRVV